MKMTEQTEIQFDVKRQKTFTLDDVEVDLGLELNVTFIDKQKDLIKAIQWLQFAPKHIGFDIETTGLDCHGNDLIMFQLGDEHRQFVIDTRVVNVSGLLPYMFNDENIIVGHNLKFEYKWVKSKYGICLKGMDDTMVQEQLLYNGSDFWYNLKAVSKRYLNYEADKTIRMRFLEIGDLPFSKDEIIYGAYDVILPCLINKMQKAKIKEQGKGHLTNMETEVTRALADIEHKGLYFDPDKWEVLYNDNMIKFKEAEKPLTAFIIDNNVTKFIQDQQDLFITEPIVTIKWTSSKQVIELLKTYNACPQEKSKQTKKLAFTVEAKVLKTSLNGMNKSQAPYIKQFIKDYIKFKELEQSVTTFGIKFFKYINPKTNRLHSDYRQIINTGRMSSSKPNLQNIPGDPRFRQCFTAPPGYKIVNADFSGQENIVLANQSLDESLLEFYAKGNSDMHSFIASKIYSLPYDDFIEAVEAKDNKMTLTTAQQDLLTKRGIAKAAGFAINYGGNGFTISKNLGLRPEEGDAVYDAYFKAFPGLRKYFDEVIEDTLKKGYITINDLSNRSYSLPMYDRMKSYEGIPSKKSAYLGLRSAIGRLALNYPVQGTAGDITKTAVAKYRQWLIDNKLHDTVFITNIVHDEINVEAPEELAERAAKGLEECMYDAGKIWCKTVELKAVAAIGDYWAH